MSRLSKSYFRLNFILLKAAFGGGKGYIDCEVHQSDT